MKRLLSLLCLFSLFAEAQTKTTLAALKGKTSITATTAKTMYYVVSGKDTTYLKWKPGIFLADDNVIITKGGAFVPFVPSVKPQPLPVYSNNVQTVTVNCEEGYTGTNTVVIQAGAYQSTISVSDANNKALAAATQQAKAGLKCIANPPPEEEKGEPVPTWLLIGDAEGSLNQYELPYPYRPWDVLPNEKIYVPRVGFQTLSPKNNGAKAADLTGVEFVFARRIADEFPNQDIRLIKLTSSKDLNYWTTDGLTALKSRLAEANRSLVAEGKKIEIKGILFVQSHADAQASLTGTQVKDGLDKIHSSINTIAGKTVPIAVYQLHANAIGKSVAAIRQGQKAFCEAGEKRFLISVDRKPLLNNELSSTALVRLGLMAGLKLYNTNNPRTDITARYGPWLIIGTPEQRSTVLDALDLIKFPFDELTFGSAAKITFANTFATGQGGWATMDGVITLEQTLYQDPNFCKQITIAEVAHTVDDGIPLTTAQRQAIMDIFGQPNLRWYQTGQGGEWETYNNIMRENFHQIFGKAYTDFEPLYRLNWNITEEQAPLVRKIIGIERTDGKQ